MLFVIGLVVGAVVMLVGLIGVSHVMDRRSTPEPNRSTRRANGQRGPAGRSKGAK